MHILELPSFFPPHGGLFCLDQARALAARGHEVRILSATTLAVTIDKGRYITLPWRRQWTEMEGIPVYRTYIRAVPRAVSCNYRRWLRTVRSMYHQYVARYGVPDIVHAHCCKCAGVAAATLGAPYVITEHLAPGLYAPDFGPDMSRRVWLRQAMTEAYRQAAYVLPVAEELVAATAPLFGTDYRWQPLSNIVDTHFFAFAPLLTPHSSLLTPRRPFRFCCLAVCYVHIKGYDVLAQAWPQVQGAELHIAGRGTENLRGMFGVAQAFFPSVRHLPVPHKAVQLGSACEREASSVHFHGNLDRAGVRQLLYHCDALVLPSRYEVQPLVLLEAMATGRPVIATECTPRSLRLPAATIVPIGDATALAQAMNHMATRRPEPQQATSQAVARLAAPEVVAEKLEAIFLQSVQGAHSPSR